MGTTKGKKHKILVVDDNSENIRIIGSILRQNTYQVGFATGGQQALGILEEMDEDYDLVLLDVNMPEINGFEVCRRIRKNSRLKDIPVIFLTANAEPEHIIEGFASGGQDYVTKPFHAGELLSRISTHIELKESRQQLKQMNAILEEKVTERTHELEEANKKLEAANRELKELDRLKADFLGLISHEINTPLNGIIGFTEILKEQLTDTEYFKFVEYLGESAQRLNEFAQSSLLITGIRTAPRKYKREAVDIRQAIEKVINKLHNKIKQKNIRLTFTNSAETPLVECNAMLIETCVIHLLNNAIQHTPEGQNINITTNNGNETLIITIQDSGPGFSEAALQNLFKPFSPGEKHVDNNMGLSLHLVKMIIDFHDAQINISKESESGAQIRVIFNQPV